jgi:ABC-type glycerol-3-phosphate transport system permease component
MSFKEKKAELKTSWKKFKTFSVSAKAVLIFYLVFFIVEAILHLMPVFFVINVSFKNKYDPLNAFAIEPQLFTMRNFVNVFTKFKVAGNLGFFGMFFNSLWSTTLRIVVSVISSTLLAYALARFRFPGRNFLYGVVIFIQTVPIMGSGGADFKLRSALGMVNNPATIWISWAVGFDYTCFILYGTFQGIAKSYSESAEIEGANQWQVLWKIIFPMVFPAILAMSITTFTGHWDDYATFQIFLSKYPNLAYGLYQYGTSKQGAFLGGKMTYYAALLCSSMPVIIIYTCSQTLILKNIAVGGLKG